MSRLRHISPKVKEKIVNDYKQKLPGGGYLFTVEQIANNNGVSERTVNYLAHQARVHRGCGRWRRLDTPSPRVLKILRDYSEPGMTLVEVGRRNGRMVNGKVMPLTKQRVQQIVSRWRERLPAGKVSRRFKRGDILCWDSRYFRVVRYIDDQKGIVHEVSAETGVAIARINPFHWRWAKDGTRAELVETPPWKAVAVA